MTKDLTGQKFGMLTVIERAENHVAPSGKAKYSMWKCVCDCGNVKIVRGSHLTSGETISCGCQAKKNCLKSVTKHGKYYSRLYGVWQNMKNRCYNRNVKCYKNYGGRGIKVCDEWLHNFEAFYDWAIATGYDENAPYMQCTLDRIDVNGNYEPSNCKWSTASEQAKNRRPTKRPKRCKYGDVSLKELAERNGLSYSTVSHRIHDRGWSLEEALTVKPRRGKKRVI